MTTLVTTNRPATTRSSTSIPSDGTAPESRHPSIDLVEDVAAAPASLGDISCWRMLTSRVPLTLLLDLALPVGTLDEMHEEMLAEPTSVDWLPAPRR